MLKKIYDAYTALLRGMHFLAGIYLGLMMVAILYWVVFRALGLEWTPYAFIFVEFGFIYVLMLGTPWLVRIKGHVYIELVTAAVPDRVRQVMTRIIAVVCFIFCFVLAYYSGVVAISDYVNLEIDARGSRDIQRWIVTCSLPVGFGLMAIEFIRYIFGSDTLHTGEAGVHE